MSLAEQHHIISAGDVRNLLSIKSALLSRESGFVTVFQRYFLSEREQMKELPSEGGAVSYILQPPLDGSRIALWLYMVSGADVVFSEGTTTVRADGLEHVWTAGVCVDAPDSYAQTGLILEKYSACLNGMGCSMADNCVRTWIFVDDIDHNYQGMVRGRREYFDGCGLTPQTHYIASTGICGKPVVNDRASVQMDAYAIRGDFSQRYLYAPTHLNPTYEYGVTFERGVRLDYSGDSHILISGTASIDNKGEVVHIGDVRGQTFRMFENVEKLLSEGECGWGDVKVAIVYLRNADDYPAVVPLIADRLGDIPYVVTLAPVCRPQWLIEMECIAVRNQ